MDIQDSGADSRTVVAVFDTPTDAEAALDALRGLGLRPEDVSVVMRDKGAAEDVAADTGANVAGGAATGAISGGLLGGLAGWLIGIGALVIPGIGPVLGAGVLATVLTGAAIGAAAGGLLGALVGVGVPEEEARTYETYVREGRVLVTVAANNDNAWQVRTALEGANAYDVRVYESSGPVDADRGFAEYSGDESEFALADADMDSAESIENVVEDEDAGDLPPEKQPVSGEAIGGAGGAVIGGLIGAAIGGPAGAAIGAAIGGAGGAGVAHVVEEPDSPPIGSPVGGGAGAVIGGIVGAAGGPVGAVVGATIGGALGGATGEALQDAGEFVQERYFGHPRDAGAEGAVSAEAPAADASAAPLAGEAPAADPGAPATIPTEFRSGGEEARNATPEQLAGSVSRDMEGATEQDASITITPGTTETEYRSGGEASRGGTK